MFLFLQDAEAAELHDQLERERLLRVTRWREQRCAAQQTEPLPTTDARLELSVEKMREQFVDALSRIRGKKAKFSRKFASTTAKTGVSSEGDAAFSAGEVLAHVSMSRTRAALALQTELGRTRLRANQRFAEQLRAACEQLQGQGFEDR